MDRIAHFSDFHLKDTGKQYLRALALMDHAIEQDGVDHLVITGDIVEGSRMDVYEAFMESLTAWGWASARRLTVVPGNHDVFHKSLSSWWFGPGPPRRFERLCALTADADGAFSTLPLGAAGRRLRVNARVRRGGEIRIGVERLPAEATEDTTAVPRAAASTEPCPPDAPARTVEDCDPIFGDHLDRVLSWQGEADIGLREGEKVRLHVRMRSAELFALEWE